MEKRVINGLTTYFCEVYKCWMTKRGCNSLQKRTLVAKRMFLSYDLPRTKAEVGFVLDPLIFSSNCPCRQPISQFPE